MNTLRFVAVLMLLAALVAPAFGQSAPEGFRDLKWGATQEQVLLAFPNADCKTERDPNADWRCTLRSETVDDVSVMIILGGYTTGKVVGMSIFSLSFKSDKVDRITDAFEARYGKPGRVLEKEFVTREGGRVPNTEWLWDFPDVTITILKHAGRLGNGIAIVSLRSKAEEFRERTEQRKRGAGKGL